MHKYLYVHGDPVNGVDPSGMWLVGLTISILTSQNIRSTATDQYGKSYDQTTTGIYALAAGHNLTTAFFAGIITAYGPDAVVGAARQAFATFIKGALRGGKPLIGVIFHSRSGKTVIPGPFVSRKGRDLIPGVPGTLAAGIPREERSKILRGNMLLEVSLPKSADIGTGLQAHHIIPIELENHAVLRRIGMEMDHGTNGILLPNTIHRGSHADYTAAIRERLNALNASAPLDELRSAVYKIQLQMTEALTSGNVSLTREFRTPLAEWRRALQ